MGMPILIMGKSGSGKTTSLRNFPTLIINVNKKPLPFKAIEGSVIYPCNNYFKIKTALQKYADEKKGKSAVIDDAGYLMTEHFMRNHSTAKGNAIFGFYNELADNFYDLIKFVVDILPDDFIVYLIMHEDKNEFGEVKPKTIGKMLDEKVCVEGLFTIVLHSLKVDGKYVFATHTDGLDVTKTPMGMFEENTIDNDLQKVDARIREYYGM